MRFYHRVDGKLSSEDVEDIVQAAVASARLSGMYTPPEDVEMLRRLAAEEISHDEYMAWVLTKAGVREGGAC